MQSPMLASHRDEDTAKVPYLPLTLTTPAYAKPDVCEQSQGFTATQVAVGDPIVAFRNEAHSLAHTCHSRAQETEVRGLHEFKASLGYWRPQPVPPKRDGIPPSPHLLLDTIANPKLAKWGLGLTSGYPHIAEGSFAGKRSGRAHIGCSASLGACGWLALSHLLGAPPVLVVALCAPWSPWSSQTL